PAADFDDTIHFAKRSKYKSEISNLLRAKSGPHIVELLGRTEDGRLVFPRLKQGFTQALREVGRLSLSLVLQLAEAVAYLHSIDIIHRDLHVRNILYSPDGNDAILCDLGVATKPPSFILSSTPIRTSRRTKYHSPGRPTCTVLVA
ncbi:kinase-like domain-containing protein, partial [Mycena albidolilacea]